MIANVNDHTKVPIDFLTIWKYHIVTISHHVFTIAICTVMLFVIVIWFKTLVLRSKSISGAGNC